MYSTIKKHSIKILLLVFLICSYSTKIVVAQQINKLFQNQYEQKLNLVLDTGNNSHATCLGEFYQAKDENRYLKLKSAKQEPSVRLLDSLKIYSYLSPDDSILLDYNANYYNTNNQLIRKKIIHKLTFFTDLKYSYNQHNDTSLIEQTIYYNGEKQGEGKYIYEYNEEYRIKSIEVQTIGNVEIMPVHNLEEYSIDIWSDPYGSYFDTLHGEFLIRYDYTADKLGRDSIVRKRYFLPDSPDWGYNGSIITDYKYYDNDIIKEKKIESIDNFGGLRTIYKYNEKGALIHYEESYGIILECEYDDSNTLRYMKRWEKYINPGLHIVYKTWKIKDTLSNAHAVYIFEKYDPSYPALKDQKYLHLIFYNNDGLISNTRKYILNTTNTQWEKIYNDTLIYNNQNQVSEYYLFVDDNILYRELYFYDNAGNKIRYEEYRRTMLNSDFAPSHKEFYYYNNGNPTHTMEFEHLQNIKVYPNPVNNYFTIENKSVAKQLNYKIFNMCGKTVNAGFMQNNTEQVDISIYPPGVYLLKFTNNENGKISDAFKIFKY